MRDIVYDIDRFKDLGFTALLDSTKEQPGALRVMRNAQITNRGGLAPRPGTIVLGTANANASPVRGLYNFRKSIGSDELFIKAYDDELEFYSRNYPAAGWTRLKNGYTAEKEFGFATALVNTDNEDYVVGSNRHEPYFRWTGAVAKLQTARVGAETSIPVDTTLVPDVYQNGTATANSTTTITVSTANWAASQWVGFYVYITDGARSGDIRLITANTATQLTFEVLAGAPGNVAFEIRKTIFPPTGTVIYNGTAIAYTAVPTATSLTVGSAHASAADVLVTLVPTEYPAAPRGNRISNYLGRIIVGNVRSALTRTSAGALQAYASAGSIFVSKLLNPFDFGYAATRVAGEGDIVSMPYGGGDITDVQYQEDTAYTFKNRYIEAVKYSQDANDFVVRDPLKAGIGSAGKTIKGADDIYFMTPDKQLTSIGRVKTKDIRPETLDLGNKIRRFLDLCGVDDLGRGDEINEKIYIPMKKEENDSANNIVLVYNRNTKTFEGIWDIGLNFMEEFNGISYGGSSLSPDVLQLFYQKADVEGGIRFPIDFEVASHWMNLTASKAYLQAMQGIVIEGYVGGGAAFTTNVWGDFSATPFFTVNFAFTDEGFLDGDSTTAFLGGAPLAIDPLAAAFSDTDSDGRRHFSFRTYFPWQYRNYYSFGFSAVRADNDMEITRTGLILKESPSTNTNRVKNT